MNSELLFILAELGTGGNTSMSNFISVCCRYPISTGFFLFAFFLENPLSLTFDPRTFPWFNYNVLCIYFSPKGIVSQGFLWVRKACNDNVFCDSCLK